MKFHNISNHAKGFTVIEMIVTIGILLILIGLSTPFTLSFYNRYQFDSERTTVIALLRQARSQSLSGIDRDDHGVYIASTQYTLYRGSSFATRQTDDDEVYEKNDQITFTGSNDINFRNLTGNSSSASFTIYNDTKTNIIHINTQGNIDWE